MCVQVTSFVLLLGKAGLLLTFTTTELWNRLKSLQVFLVAMVVTRGTCNNLGGQMNSEMLPVIQSALYLYAGGHANGTWPERWLALIGRMYSCPQPSSSRVG